MINAPNYSASHHPLLSHFSDSTLPETFVDSLDHPLLEPYRELRSRNWTEQSGIFVAEGPLLVEAMLASDYRIQSVLIDQKFYDRYVNLIDSTVELIVVRHELVATLVGFNFHRGVLACGYRKPIPKLASDFGTPATHETMFAAIGVQDPENLGGMLRSCAAFGIRRVIVGPGTADPLSRRSLRVSMGNVLKLQLFRSTQIAQDLDFLRSTYGIEIVATSLAPTAVSLESATRTGPLLLMVGNERNGLPLDIQCLADRHVRIDMSMEVDSLNVGVASAIVMHYFCRIARNT